MINWSFPIFSIGWILCGSVTLIYVLLHLRTNKVLQKRIERVQDAGISENFYLVSILLAWPVVIYLVSRFGWPKEDIDNNDSETS